MPVMLHSYNCLYIRFDIYMPVMLHSYNRLLFLLLQRKGDVMIRHIAGMQISSPLESRRLDMWFMLELGTGFD